jgi:ketosteroid isomerase-like protein
MTESDVEIVREWAEAMVRFIGSPDGRVELAERAKGYMAPDCVYEEDPVWPDAGEFRGRDAVLQRFGDYVELVHLAGASLESVLDGDGVVLAKVRIEMLGEGEGTMIGFLWSYTVRVEDGQIVHSRAWYRPEEAARAAGLPA